MNLFDLLEEGKKEDLVRDKVRNYLKLFNQSFKQIEIMPFNFAQVLFPFGVGSRYFTGEFSTPWTTSIPQLNPRVFFFGDYILNNLVNPFTSVGVATVSEINFIGSTAIPVIVKERAVTALETMTDVVERGERFFSSVGLSHTGASNSINLAFNFTGVKFTLK